MLATSPRRGVLVTPEWGVYAGHLMRALLAALVVVFTGDELSGSWSGSDGYAEPRPWAKIRVRSHVTANPEPDADLICSSERAPARVIQPA